MLQRIQDRHAVHGVVPHTLVQALCSYLRQKRMDPSPLMPKGLQETATHALERVPAEAFCQFQIQAAQALQDPLLGLHLGQTIQPSHLGALGYALLACDNLGAALMRIQRYHRLMHDINPITYHHTSTHVELRWGMAMGRPGALFDETGVTAIVQFAQELCGRPLPIDELDFVNPPPKDSAPYDAFFRCKVRFGQTLTRLSLRLDCLQWPLRQHDPHLLKLMDEQVQASLDALPSSGDLVEQTRRALRYLAPQGVPELDRVASELRLSPRVLYRRLAAQGHQFRDLREQTLEHTAKSHLQEGRLPMSDIALLLGYSEQSAFTRAFKRWTGQSPVQWRQTQAHQAAVR
ncbi:MAG: AraC family transcriptional regulator [Aquabacterium sp.]|jgi:AraC-like DNA-binding protein|nr:AraC family transcriptional regulator [Aquabacterium sp.]